MIILLINQPLLPCGTQQTSLPEEGGKARQGYPGKGRCWLLLQRASSVGEPMIQLVKQKPLTLGVGRSSTPCPIACEEIMCQESIHHQENVGSENLP